MTKYPTYIADTESLGTFDEYTTKHQDSWVRFARIKGHKKGVQPILVSGFDVTRDFAMLAYSSEDVSFKADLVIDFPITSIASIRVSGTSTCSPHRKCWPQPWSKPAIDIPSSQSMDLGPPPDGFKCCVFVRYFTSRPQGWKEWLFGNKPKVRARPRNPGPGNNRDGNGGGNGEGNGEGNEGDDGGSDGGDTSPEPAEGSSAEPTTDGNEALGGQSDLATDDTGSEPVVVRNAPYV